MTSKQPKKRGKDRAATDGRSADAPPPPAGASPVEPSAVDASSAGASPVEPSPVTAIPAVPDAPRRVSSPVEIAAVLRQTPAKSMPAVVPDVPALTQDIADYATTLRLRLEASAPSAAADFGADERDTRSLRERVAGRSGMADLLMFRIGHELFATDLGSVEEAVELPAIHHLPEMPAAMLGAFNLRGRLTPIYSPAHVIGVPLRGVAAAALLVRANGRRMGLAVDDVEDVLQIDLAGVHDAPGIDDADGILLGVAHHGQQLVAVIDAEALVAACLTGHALETA